MPNQFALRDQTNTTQAVGTFWGNRYAKAGINNNNQENSYQSSTTPSRGQHSSRSGPSLYRPNFGGNSTPQSGARPSFGNNDSTPQSAARAVDNNYGFSSQRRQFGTPGSNTGSTPGLNTSSNSAFKPSSATTPQRPLFKKYLLRELEPQEKAPLVTVVFDLDETLVSNRRADLPEALLRSYCIDVLHAVRRLEGVEVVLWTASTEETGSPVVEQLEREGKVFDQVIFRSDEWFTEPMHTKDLRLLGRPMDRVIVFDNAPNCVKLNRFNAILVDDYHGGENPEDETLANIFKMIETLRNGVSKGRTVPEMLKGFATERSAGVYTVQYALPEAWQRTNLRDLSPVMIPAQGKFFKITQEHLPTF